MNRAFSGGYAQPSASDIDLTKRLAGAADLLQIKLLDHVIIGCPDRQVLEEEIVDERTCSVRMARKARKARESRRISRQGYYSFKEEFAL